MCANISALAGVKWYLGMLPMFVIRRTVLNVPVVGIPFNDTSNLRLEIAEQGQRILGDNLLALQAGNEPDLYAAYAFLEFSFQNSF
jgi:hypothetical protein